MNPAEIRFPSWTSAQLVFNHLDVGDAHKMSDLVFAIMADGSKVDVGWYPENDPDGKYVATVYSNDFDNPLAQQAFQTASYVVDYVEKQARDRAENPMKVLSFQNLSEPTAFRKYGSSTSSKTTVSMKRSQECQI